MNEQDQVRAIAELDGYLQIGEKPFGKTELRWMGLHKNAGSPSEWWDLPNYLHSYDAIIPVIQKLELWQDVSIEAERVFGISFSLRLTPSQLCQALLRATGKWIE